MDDKTPNPQQQQRGQGSMSQGQGQQIGSPISNDAFDIISALHKKLEGLEAYRKYAQNGQPHVWKQLSDLDQQAVSTLVDRLEELVRDGKFRMGTPGQAGKPTAKG
jgi:hypothetical protein